MNNDKTHPKERLVKRLRYLWTWELFDSFFFPAIVVFSAWLRRKPLGLFAIYATGLVTWLLWQGAAYWWLKLQAVKRESGLGARRLRWFAALKKINWAFIAVLPVLMAVKGLVGTAFKSSIDVAAGLGLYALAVLEQINYYHVQLMYDFPPDWRYLVENRRLKRSSLNRALQRLWTEDQERDGRGQTYEEPRAEGLAQVSSGGSTGGPRFG